MTRTRLTITVFGDTHSEVMRKLENSIMSYLEVESSLAGTLDEYIDMEIEIMNADLEDGYSYKAVAYCKLKI